MRSDVGPTPDRLGFLLKLGFYGFLVFIAVPLCAWILSPAGYIVAATGATLLAGLIANAVSLLVFERVSLSAIGLDWDRGSLGQLGTGVAAGVLAGAVVTLVPLALGLATLEADPRQPASLWGFLFVTLLLLFGAFGEELLFRGYGFQLLWRHMGTTFTLGATAFLFGLVHLSNLNVAPLGILNTIGFGVVLGYGFIRTEHLWLPIGLHFGWNWILPLVGGNLSGFTIGLSGYTLRWHVPAVWSGGLYGPEAGVPASLIVVALAAWLHRLRPRPAERQEGLDVQDQIGHSGGDSRGNGAG
ncbi:MAG TPA: type II CAAX endopeptidase family protein [Bryobacteraceae bacterium]|nr:type II CAAX endopeptidase family protein [Bryobacteraceae bacterium]